MHAALLTQAFHPQTFSRRLHLTSLLSQQRTPYPIPPIPACACMVHHKTVLLYLSTSKLPVLETIKCRLVLDHV